MKKVLLIFCLLLCAAVAGANAQTYPAKGQGYGGEMNLSVVIENNAIADIVLGDHHETNVVIDRAFPVIRERILSAASPAVDAVTGATFTSNAVKAAVKDAMAQAGMDVSGLDLTARHEEKAAAHDDEAWDIVIVGGGPSGLAAGIGAKEADAEAKVLLIEKLDILGGNGKFNMNFFDIINTKAQQLSGNKEWTENQIENFLKAKEKSGETPERVQVWAQAENGMDAWLRGMGVELNYNYGGTNHMAEADRYAGEAILDGLEKAAAQRGIVVRTGTKGVDLVMENGACKGVVVETDQHERYTLYAKAVVVATGGFCNNKDLLKEYAPGHEVLATSNQMGATGDFVKVFEKNGFAMEQMGKMSVFGNIIVPRRDLTGGADLNLLVNREGALLPNKSGLDRGKMVLEQPGSAAYYITDETGYASFYRIRKHVGLGYYKTGETLQQLAEALGIEPEGLVQTVEAFNKDAAEGRENAVLAAVPKRPLDAAGPYYGVRVEAANHMTKGGVVANEKAQVLLPDGAVVPGLYAAGEVTWQSGGFSQSVCFGRIAGTQAATELK